MKKVSRYLAALLAVIMAFSLFAACADQGDPAEEGEKISYTVTLASKGGTPLENVTVLAMVGEDTKDAQITNAEGKVTFSLPAAEYTLAFENVPAGYTPEQDSYKTDKKGTPVNVVFNSSIIAGGAPSGTVYQMGDIMYDFSYTESESGEEKSLIEVFESKKLIVLNFWYTTCSWCVTEFPLMEQAYQQYKEDVAIIAVNDMKVDGTLTDADVTAFKKELGLTFDFTMQPTVGGMFTFSGYPTSVLVDRYGTICMIEEGAITDVNVWIELFENYTKDDYEQDVGGDGEVEKPNIENPDPSAIAAAINAEGCNVTYRWDTESEYSWPWIVGEDGKSIQTPIAKKNGAYAMVMMDIVFEKGQVLAFEYKTSTEAGNDVFYVIVDGEIAQSYSGTLEQDNWKTCFAYVGDGNAEQHEVALVYMKNESVSLGDDTVYVRNMHFTDTNAISDAGQSLDVLRYAATNLDETDPANPYYKDHAQIVLNETDGYYHVGTANGPLLLTTMNGDTRWGPNLYVTMMKYVDPVSESIIGDIGPDDPEYVYVEYYEELTDYAWLSANSDIGYIPVTEDAKAFMQVFTAAVGNDNDQDEDVEWLEMCIYYDHYGIGDPIDAADPTAGLNMEKAIKAELNTPNHVSVTKMLVPRGYFYSFTPETSGSYIIYSVGDYDTYCWLFDDHKNLLSESFEPNSEVGYADKYNFEIIWYMEAGVTYYIACDMFQVGLTGEYDFYIVSSEMDSILSNVVPGFYTSDDLGSGGGEITLNQYIEITQDDLGYYYELRDDGTIGSPIYADFTHKTIFSDNALVEWIAAGKFDFTNNLLVEEQYRKDYSDRIEYYAAQKDSEGLVMVNDELREILVALMQSEDGLTDNAWLRVCKYYKALG